MLRTHGTRFRGYPHAPRPLGGMSSLSGGRNLYGTRRMRGSLPSAIRHVESCHCRYMTQAQFFRYQRHMAHETWTANVIRKTTIVCFCITAAITLSVHLLDAINSARLCPVSEQRSAEPNPSTPVVASSSKEHIKQARKPTALDDRQLHERSAFLAKLFGKQNPVEHRPLPFEFCEPNHMWSSRPTRVQEVQLPCWLDYSKRWGTRATITDVAPMTGWMLKSRRFCGE
jgi:hypothetical protein